MPLARRLAIGLIFIGLLVSAPALRAADVPPSVSNAIARGCKFLEKEIPEQPSSGESVLGALALVKAGQPPETPAVQAVLREIEKRCSGTDYKPAGDHYYVAGLEIMLLESIDPEHYYEEIRKILGYILKGQLKGGAWYYPNQNGTGDTSITQYAALGMWSATRAGHDVPASAWERMAAWHLKTQHQNGAFSYHPGQPDDKTPNGALTFGGGANLLLARLHLFGDRAKANREPTADSQESKTKRFGVLESVDLDEADEAKDSAKSQKQAASNIQLTAAHVGQSVVRARNWSAVNFRLPPPVQYKMYYLYAMERMMALGNMETLGPHNWYAAGAQLLVKRQTPEGTWDLDGGGDLESAAFGVLFLSRSTAKMLGRSQGVPGLGGGILAGGRGLPGDLSTVNVSDGEVKTKKGTGGAIDELLARLESAQVGEVPATQQAILDSVRFGDREKLLDEQERIRRLVSHPRPEVRRTAFWVLGRAGDLSDVPRLIEGLSDPEIDVAIEAHNALCVLSRRPLGLGVPADPLADLGEDADEAARKQAIKTWREKATTSWKDWYRTVAPYQQRDGLGLFHENS